MNELWIFGYGSLMWRPGFASVEAAPAVLHGYNRSFCIYSVHHRGSGLWPGLVLGLDRGGTCHGMAYRISPEDARVTLGYLRDREQVTGVYREIVGSIALLDGSHRRVGAVCYVAERAHPQYTGSLDLGRQAAIIRGAYGVAGPNTEYAVNTVAHLRAMGVHDPLLERLIVLLGASARRAFDGTSVSGGITAGRRRPTVATAAGNILRPRSLPRVLHHRFGYRRRLSD